MELIPPKPLQGDLPALEPLDPLHDDEVYLVRDHCGCYQLHA